MQISPQYLLLTEAALSRSEAKAIEFYPDTIPYIDNEDEFQKNWQNLVAENIGYLYVDHHEIKKVSAWRYYFEKLKGKFGFEDHCNKSRVEFTLLKYSYYGLVNGYAHASQFFLAEPVEPNQTLVNYQQKLMNYYLRYSEALQPSFWTNFFSSSFSVLTSPFQKRFIFGDSIATLSHLTYESYPIAATQNLEMLLKLKPTSSQFIGRYLNLITNLVQPEKVIDLLQPNSSLALAVANQYMQLANKNLNQNVFQQWMSTMVSAITGAKMIDRWDAWYRYAQSAIKLDANIQTTHLHDFINYELHRKNYEQAVELILKLKDVNEQVALLRVDENRIRLVKFLKKDTPTARALAASYIADVKKMYFGKTQLFDLINQLASHDLDPAFFIQHYIDQKEFANAASLFKQHPNVLLDDPYRVKLANFCSKEGREFYETGNASSRSLLDREQYFRLSLQAKKQAAKLNHKNKTYQHDVNIGRRVLAQSIFQSIPFNDEEKSVQQLDGVIKKYEKSYSQNAKTYDAQLIPSFVKALVSRAEIALKHCYHPQSYSDGVSASVEEKELCKDQLSIGIQYLNRALKIMDKHAYPNLWAKVQFMLGDIGRYFELSGFLDHLKEAAEAQPNNPFYCASYAQVAGDDDRLAEAWDIFKDAGLNPNDYFDWKAERWNKDKIFSNKLGDIHQYIAPPKSSFSKMMGY